jgi:hypothetical protein
MFPIRYSSIFKSRWWALLWAAGIIWFAYDFAAPDVSSNESVNAEAPTDATGAPITSDDEKQLEKALNGL